MKEVVKTVQDRLFANQDLQYKRFNSQLIPTVDPQTMIGVRTPQLRKIAAEVSKMSDAGEFLKVLPHTYYEENQVHGFLLERLGDYEEVIRQLDAFLPYVDNWATCDMISPKVFKKHRQELLGPIDRWIHQEHTYTVRFGIGMLMKWYLDDAFSPDYIDWVTGIRSQEYYIDMMIAWYLATALAKQYEAVLPVLEARTLDPWVHNKAIQKALESRRIAAVQKEYLRSLKIRA